MKIRWTRWVFVTVLFVACLAFHRLWVDLSWPLFTRSKNSWKKNIGLSNRSRSMQLPEKLPPFNVTDVEKKLKIALEASRNKIIIINWYPPFGDLVQFDFLPYECGNCQVTLDRKKIDDPNAKAVVFHFNELKLWTMPQKRRLDQYYVWRDNESPPALLHLRKMQLDEYDNVFNMTMNYRRDSDICSTEFSIPRIWERRGSERMTLNQLDDFVNQKTGIALWVVSNCGSTKGALDRMEYMKVLRQSGLHDITLAGACFGSRKKAIDYSKYKFYFALENNWNCRDYITEKFYYNGLISGAVPVVIGPSKAEYEAIAPPNSFIYAWDFPTPEALVKYLRYLDGNDTAYKEYLKWTTVDLGELPRHTRRTDWCQLCRILHGINVDNLFNPAYELRFKDIPLFGHPGRPRIVTSLSRWFYDTENLECLYPNS